METVKDRILQYLKFQGLGQNRFEAAVGLSQGYIHKLKDSPSATKLAQICDAFPDINRTWLLSGEGEMLISDTRPEISYTHGVPYYDEDFTLGFDILVDPVSERPQYLINMPGFEAATIWCNASGHSMEPEISNGDIIALQCIDDPSFLPYGDIYGIVATNGMRTIKRIRRASSPDRLLLVPTNPDYDSQEIPRADIRRIFRVLGAMKRF